MGGDSGVVGVVCWSWVLGVVASVSVERSRVAASTLKSSAAPRERYLRAGVAGAFRGVDRDSGFPCLYTAGTVANFGTGKTQRLPEGGCRRCR